MKNHTKQITGQFLVYLILSIIVLISIFPIFWMCLISIKDISESISGLNSIRVYHPTFDNYLRLFRQIPIASNIFNSVFTTTMGTLTTVFFCALAGFSFAKYKFPGRDFLFYFVIATMLIPPEVGAIPQFIIMKKLHLINSLWALVIPRIATAVGIFYMRQYIVNVPDELIEASKIDGCKDFGIFYKIIIPVIKPALASWASLTIVARWNDFFWPLLFLRKTSKYTLMVSISLLPVSDGLSTPWQVILAGTTIVIIPVIFAYLVLQYFHKEGLTAGAVKG
ncbi:ABC-type sugar transport system, permease component [Sphaerochaeta pleomorpha str. Grapes]|uniref:ABC-type sugar transport system, permease component n=1 Tax=Sphaerochaeta pleomorpha (strain ATCC BAA-1885 / DSM 22778 / Grapes) TaxID=158190 RepID=G8QTP8_SPHPG|nr:carbohydrate ABC transporter permease [Sphaerochaeta pleomorpha]AEV28013.1 ABC-type sugar transport system, permease component [Sphaerochaeta pleomorpha str. Grapes]